ncbi:inactive serine/threonine-protein kinase PLK5 [Sciurus carolinensis]|uniref:inactive serine/threonine-protein kinase PLK5 n=1 Tax=Sciurus carolinensis TaxID=30640 RepID=UPI001FB319F0|nr:inactive serine/threonine-protein kinase PLK5 [Sciurus carolinensis]
MEPGLRRRCRSHQPVAAFLRDPASGRVYRRGKLIGKGAFSRCYKLTDMSTSAVFALKVVPRGGAGRLPSRGKVEREIALHSRLRHRNIVAFHGHFSDRDHVYMVLEYCSRQSLAHVLKVRQTLTEPEVRYYLRGSISGLRYLHQRSIVHRDLKLSNLFLNKNMEVKIGDLGLAARVGPGGHCHRVLCGTPSLLAPEVVSRKGHSFLSDIWALGCIMYTVLTGTPPFVAASLSEMYQNIREGRYPEPADLSPHARRLIARLLAPDPAERPSLDHLLQDDFFTQGFTPERLPPHSCHSPPLFTFPQPLGRLCRKMGQLLLTQCGPPCPFTPKEASGPGEEGPEPDSSDCGGQVRPQAPGGDRLPTSTSSEPGVHPPLPRRRDPVLPKPRRTPTLRGLPPAWGGPSPSPGGAHLPLLFPASAAVCKEDGTAEALSGRAKFYISNDFNKQLSTPHLCAQPHRNPGEQWPILWAPKWVDYSSKYGFGYQLSDGGSGVLFRDGTHMALRPPGSHICYLPARARLETFAARDALSVLGAKLAVLRLFACYMQRRLREEGASPAPQPPAVPGLCLLRFLGSSRALLLLFSSAGEQGLAGGDQGFLAPAEGSQEIFGPCKTQEVLAPEYEGAGGAAQGSRLAQHAGHPGPSSATQNNEAQLGTVGGHARWSLWLTVSFHGKLMGCFPG